MSQKLTRPPRTDNPDDMVDFYEQVERQLNLVGTRTLAIGSVGAGSVLTFTITVMGCRVNMSQTVAVAAPSTLDAGLVWCGVVTANDTVTVRVYNPTGAPIVPASDTWGVRVFL